MSNIPSSNYNQTTQQPIAKPIAKPTGEWATGEPSKMNNRDWSGQVKPGLEHDPLTSTSTSHKALDSSISSGEARMDSDFGRQSGMGSHGYQSSTVPSTHSSTLGSSSGIGAGSVLVGSSLPTSHTTTTTTTTDHHKSGGLLNKIMHPHQSSASGSAIHSSTTSTTTTDHHKSGGMLSNILHPHHSSSTASTDLHSSTTSTTTTDHHKSGGMLSNLLHPHHSSASTSSDVSSSTTSDQHKSGGIMGGLFGHKDHHTGSSLGTTTSSSSHHKDTAPHVPVPIGAGMGSGLPGMVSSLLGTDMARGVAHNEGTLNQPPVVTNQPGTTGVFTQKKL